MSDLQNLYNEIEQLINSEAGESGRPFVYGKFEGVGWLNFHYSCTAYEGPYPRIALKQQKNAIHFYVMLWVEGKSILENYIHIFGKTSIGKGCIRIKKLSDERKNALSEIVRIAIEKNKTTASENE